jgi:ketosteroid isomerase-like protein
MPKITHAQVMAATDQLVAAFAATDTEAYFACFSADATFVFHPEPARLDDRATYERLWASWLDEGWRVVSCSSTERLVQILGDAAVLSHTVDTVVSVHGQQSTSRERESIIFALDGEHAPPHLLAVHEHISPVPEPS